MVTNPLNHQESGTYNLQQLTSNPGHLLPKTSPVVSAIMGRLNHHDIDNGDVEVHPSYFSAESNYETVLDPDTTPIKSMDDYEMYLLLEFFHSEHDDHILDVYLQILQA